MSSAIVVKRPYVRPSLTVFGSVRNLTGGSNGRKHGDGHFMTML